MALCSSAYNPVAQFTKHAYGDRELHRDRLVSKRSGTPREGFRRGVYIDDTSISDDFTEFSNSHVLLPTSFSSTQKFPCGDQQQVLRASKRDEAITWSSEFKRGQFPQFDSPPARDHYLARPVDHKPSISHNIVSHRPNDQIHSNHLFLGGNLSVTPRGLGIESNCHPMTGSVGSQKSSSTQALDNLDWETVFKSLEPASKRAEVERLKSSYSQGLVETPLDSPTTPSKEESCFPHCLLPTRPASIYQFQDENPFSQVPNPFDEGIEIIINDGNLSFAALAFEAACQMDCTHLEAWRMLGSVQAENEREEAAIRALKEAQKLDPQDLDIMMKLAVSYTNEGHESLAYENLERWLRTKYPLVPIDEVDSDMQFPSYSQSLERIKDPFIRAAQLSVTTGNFDPDVQIGLGVLLFSEDNYEMAADCFASAIQSFTPGATNTQSQLHLLWNRYGACLGNMGKHEEAIDAYEMALAIRPNFVRARCNLGLIYYNQNDGIMGARHTLQALQAYKAAESQTRTDMLKIVKVGTSHGRLEEMMHNSEPLSIYDALRKCCNSMCRWDLAEAVGPNMDIRKFQRELDSL